MSQACMAKQDGKDGSTRLQGLYLRGGVRQVHAAAGAQALHLRSQSLSLGCGLGHAGVRFLALLG